MAITEDQLKDTNYYELLGLEKAGIGVDRDMVKRMTKRLKELLKKRFGPPQHNLLGCKLREGDTVTGIS